MYAIEAPPVSSGHGLSTRQDQAGSSHPDLEAMTSSHLYNLDSASISGYAHPSSHSPYNNQAAHNLLLPSSATYHHPLELNPTSVGPHTNSQHVPIDASEAQQRISHPSGYDFFIFLKLMLKKKEPCPKSVRPPQNNFQ